MDAKSLRELAVSDPVEFARQRNSLDYACVRKQTDALEPYSFGSNINVLLITDRGHGLAVGLRQYFGKSTDISVDLVYSLSEAKKVIQQKRVDFLVVVGMFENEENYKSIQMVKKAYKHIIVLMYAYIDPAIRFCCEEYGIEHLYSCLAPVEGFVEYMRSRYLGA